MGIDYICPTCGKRYDLSDDLAGKRARCKPCGNEFRVPASTTYARDDFDPYALEAEPPRLSPRPVEDDEFATPPRRFPKKERAARSERREGLFGWGIRLLVIGGGAFLLPLFGLQWKVLNLLDESAQLGLGLIFLVIGAICVVCSRAGAWYSVLSVGGAALAGLFFLVVVGIPDPQPAPPPNRPAAALIPLPNPAGRPIPPPPRHVFRRPPGPRLPTPAPTPPPPTFVSPPPPSFASPPPPSESPPPSTTGFPSAPTAAPTATGFPPPPQ